MFKITQLSCILQLFELILKLFIKKLGIINK